MQYVVQIIIAVLLLTVIVINWFGGVNIGAGWQPL